MTEITKYEYLGLWFVQQFSTDVFVCQIFGPRWKFEWGSCAEIVDALRIELSANVGLIVPNLFSSQEVDYFRQQANAHWQKL